jgi:hypothetical protein
MVEENLPVSVGPPSEDKSFEQLKAVNEHGAEYWSARDLQPRLGYHHWRSFEKAIAKAITSCRQSGNDPEHHFARARKPIVGGRGAARNAGVHSAMFGVFHDAGYKGLYGGLGSDEIKARKRIAPGENLLDRMGTTELAANQFRMTQTREKLAKEGIRGQKRAIDTHRQVGKEVRQAIRRIGGTMPESLPPAEDIKQVQKRLKESTPPLQLDGPDAKGLTGPEQNK